VKKSPKKRMPRSRTYDAELQQILARVLEITTNPGAAFEQNGTTRTTTKHELMEMEAASALVGIHVMLPKCNDGSDDDDNKDKLWCFGDG
jgi:hypothetical protein